VQTHAVIFVALAVLQFTGCSENCDYEIFDGFARINEQGTISLSLYIYDGKRSVHLSPYYEVTDPEYKKIAEHVGPIKIGQEIEIEPLLIGQIQTGEEVAIEMCPQ